MDKNKNANSSADVSHPLKFVRNDPAARALLVLNQADDVGVALRPLKNAEKIPLENGTELHITARVATGHKVALRAISAGSPVHKYAQLIGFASHDIEAGEHVHSHNLAFRATDHDYQFSVDCKEAAIDMQTDTFLGYQRADGRVGTRNYIAVLSSVNCSATAARCIAEHFDNQALAAYENIDGVVSFTHATGCGLADSGDGFDNLQRVFKGFSVHPNIAAVLIVGLGCEVSQIQTLVNDYGLERGPLLQTMNIQTIGGHKRTVEKGVALIESMLDATNDCQRVEVPVSALTLALQCGGSDAWSGITANPALGHAVDLLVAQGATAVLAETPEVYGAEHLLTRRARTKAIGLQLLDRISWWEDYVARNGGSMDNNPSPGNKLGGLTTILEKSLGAVAKAGSTTLNGVYRYAEPVTEKGFVFMDSPGYDPASVTGEVAGGCNLVAFTTGRGSTYGCKPSPSIKIATNTDMYERLSEDMDINAGRIVSDGIAVEVVGREIYDYLLAVASGQASLSESQGLGENEFIPWQIGATM